jgi:hypothetical protein
MNLLLLSHGEDDAAIVPQASCLPVQNKKKVPKAGKALKEVPFRVDPLSIIFSSDWKAGKNRKEVEPTLRV